MKSDFTQGGRLHNIFHDDESSRCNDFGCGATFDKLLATSASKVTELSDRLRCRRMCRRRKKTYESSPDVSLASNMQKWIRLFSVVASLFFLGEKAEKDEPLIRLQN